MKADDRKLSRTEANRKRKRVRIRYRRAAIVLSLLILVVFLTVNDLLAAAGTGSSYNRKLLRKTGDPNAKAPDIKAESAALYSLDLDRMVYEKNADYMLAPYSITKLLTCYLALENLDPEEEVTISKNACVELEDGMMMLLEPGEKIKVIDLLYAAMMMSANDGATALGEAVSGDIKSFSDLMNKTVQEWGCEGTHFVNANGWDDRDHYTTARDMAIITKNCLENDTLRKISMQKYYTVPATNKSEPLLMESALLKTMNDNKLITGGKTGSWDEDKCSIALEFTDKGFSGVIVLLDDDKDNRPKDVVKLMDFSHSVTPGFRVTKKGDKVCSAWVKHGKKTKVKLAADRQTVAYPKTESEKSIKVKTKVSKLKAPVKKGDEAGTFTVFANGQPVSKGKLIVSEDAGTGLPLSYLYVSDHTSLLLGAAITLIIVLGCLLQAADNRREAKRRTANRRRANAAKH